MKIVVVGLGKIGNALVKELLSYDKFEVIGVDIDSKKFIQNITCFNSVFEINADYYFITVYTSNQVLDVINSINFENKPLILVESTISLKDIDNIIEKVNSNDSYLSFFPHRFCENDSKHQIFNLKRVIGSIDVKSKEKTIEFLNNFMDLNDLVWTNPKVAVLSKLVENSQRYMDIIFAQEISLLSKKESINFEELRNCVNSKWNIELKEALNGVTKGCLEKDILLLNELMKNDLLTESLNKNKEYIKIVSKSENYI